MATRQLFQPGLESTGFTPVRAVVTPNKFHWALSARVLCPPGELSIMLSQPADQIGRDARVECIVRAAQQIDVPAHIGRFEACWFV